MSYKTKLPRIAASTLAAGACAGMAFEALAQSEPPKLAEALLVPDAICGEGAA